MITVDVSNARFSIFTLKHVARPVELCNQFNATSVQIKHCQTQINYFNINFIIHDHVHLLIQSTAALNWIVYTMKHDGSPFVY